MILSRYRPVTVPRRPTPSLTVPHRAAPSPLQYPVVFYESSFQTENIVSLHRNKNKNWFLDGLSCTL
jgi:hypothetical protein